MQETQHAEQLISELNEHISEGQLVLFCGAGISMPSPTCLPSFSQYQRAIVDETKNLLPEFDQKALKNEIDILCGGKFPPEILTQKLFNYWGTKAIRLTDVFYSQQLKSNDNHKIIASLARNKKIPIILTTNFDRLIEREIGDENMGVEGINAIQDLISNIKSGQKFDKPQVVKLHGSAGNEEDIIVTLNQEGRPNLHIRDLVGSILEKNVLLVVGYSGRDFDLMPIILGAAGQAKAIYWVFYPPDSEHPNEVKTKGRVDEKFGNRFHPVVLDSTELLLKLLPLEEQQYYQSKLPVCRDDKEKFWKEQIKSTITEQTQQVDIRRTYMIFTELAGHLEKWAAAEKFLEASWKVNRNDQDDLGLAETAVGFSQLYENQLNRNPSTKLMTRVNYWWQQSKRYADLTEDPFVNGEIANSNAIRLFEGKRDMRRAIEEFKRAENCYLNIMSGTRRGQIDQLIAHVYFNIGKCYIELCSDIATEVSDDFRAKSGYRKIEKVKFKMAIKESVLNTLASAAKYLKMAEERYRKIGAINSMAEVRMNFGDISGILGEFDGEFRYYEAIKEFKYALDIYESISDLFGQAQAHKGIGTAFGHLNKHDKKDKHLKIAANLFQEIGFLRSAQECHALIDVERRDNILAISSFTVPSQSPFSSPNAEESAAQTNSMSPVASDLPDKKANDLAFHRRLGAQYLSQSDYSKAIVHFKHIVDVYLDDDEDAINLDCAKAENLCKELNIPPLPWESEIDYQMHLQSHAQRMAVFGRDSAYCRKHAWHLEQQGQTSKAKSLYKRAVDEAYKCNSDEIRGAALCDLGAFHKRRRHKWRAKKYFQLALIAFQKTTVTDHYNPLRAQLHLESLLYFMK